jgi:hypothetical protein
MSDNWMIVIPVDPLAVPLKERAEAAFALLTTMRPEAEEPELYLSDQPKFFHCGSNFGVVVEADRCMVEERRSPRPIRRDTMLRPRDDP